MTHFRSILYAKPLVQKTRQNNVHDFNDNYVEQNKIKWMCTMSFK